MCAHVLRVLRVAAGDYLRMGVPRDERVYEEVTDVGKLTTLLGSYLEDYNLEHKTPLQLGEALRNLAAH